MELNPPDRLNMRVWLLIVIVGAGTELSLRAVGKL